jgi:hypothetical protein
MWGQIQDKAFGGVRIHAAHGMWNAGVVGIPAEKTAQAIALALAICDDFSRQQVTPRLIEQFAISVALEETYPLHAARPFIGHYWSTKDEWNEHIAAFLLESHLRQRTVEQDLAALEHFNFRVAPVKKMLKNTRWRLHHLVDRVFPPTEIVYAGPE